jgi:hypothetical protein
MSSINYLLVNKPEHGGEHDGRQNQKMHRNARVHQPLNVVRHEIHNVALRVKKQQRPQKLMSFKPLTPAAIDD